MLAFPSSIPLASPTASSLFFLNYDRVQKYSAGPAKRNAKKEKGEHCEGEEGIARRQSCRRRFLPLHLALASFSPCTLPFLRSPFAPCPFFFRQDKKKKYACRESNTGLFRSAISHRQGTLGALLARNCSTTIPHAFPLLLLFRRETEEKPENFRGIYKGIKLLFYFRLWLIFIGSGY